MIRSRTILVAVLMVSFSHSLPAPAAQKLKIPLTIKLMYSTSYDDNILNYSSRDLERFRNEQEPYLPPITTADDWINSLGLRLYRDFDLGRRFHVRPYYSGKMALYAVNQIKNMQSHNLQVRFSYRSQIYLSLKYFYIPSYFLRVYHDRDTGQYHGAEFTLSRPSLALRLRRNSIELEIEGGREYNYYNTYFTEYDVEADFLGATATYSGIPFLDVSLGYTFKKADNVGFNQSLPQSLIYSIVDSEYGDGSYEENQYTVGLEYQLPRLKKNVYWKAALELKRSYRYYQSHLLLEQDPFHAGRRDRRDTIAPTLTLSPTSELDLQLNFTYDLRRSQSDNPDAPLIKNYDDRAIEFTIVYQVF